MRDSEIAYTGAKLCRPACKTVAAEKPMCGVGGYMSLWANSGSVPRAPRERTWSIRTDPEKVTAVKDCPVYTSLKELGSFPGLCFYYRRIVKVFATIAAPHHLMEKETQSAY